MELWLFCAGLLGARMWVYRHRPVPAAERYGVRRHRHHRDGRVEYWSRVAPDEEFVLPPESEPEPEDLAEPPAEGSDEWWAEVLGRLATVDAQEAVRRCGLRIRARLHQLPGGEEFAAAMAAWTTSQEEFTRLLDELTDSQELAATAEAGTR